MFIHLLFAASSCIVCFVLYLIKSKRNYWKKKSVVYTESSSIFGNFSEYILLKKYLGKVEQEICRKYPSEPYIGTFYGTEPALIVQDPKLIKLIMTKDFYYFSSRDVSKYTHKEVTTQNLFFTYGDRWKVMRQNLTPLFTSTKMKNMFHLIEKCCYEFEKLLDSEVANAEVEARTLAARYTMDCIGSCAFGVNTNTMGRDSTTNPFTVIGNKILESSTSRAIKWISRSMWPSIFYGLRFKNFPQEIDYFFNDLLKNVFQGREYKPSNRNDFIDLMLYLKTNKVITGDSLSNAKTGENRKVELEANDELLVSNCVSFFAAGYETSATTVSFMLYELAKDKNIQAQVQKEIDEYLKARNNKINYDCITELEFTEACINEVLRLYPVLGVITREVVDEYTLPDGLRLSKDMRVHIPVYHLHHNPEYFPEPKVFRPERFYAKEKNKIQPYTYMPFGEGPRICIGMRFAKMQMIPGLITVLKKYSVELAEGMPTELEFEPRAIITQSRVGIRLKFTPRDGWERRAYAK